MYLPIKDYAVIGDTHSAALISRDGSLDWACLPYFDSPAMFLRILDDEQGGYCRIVAHDLKSQSRRYLPETNILENTFTTGTGTLQVLDFMPVRPRKDPSDTGQDVDCDHRIIRLLRCASGSVRVDIELWPTFNFARDQARVLNHANELIYHDRETELRVHGCDFSVGARGKAVAAVSLKTGDTRFLSLTWAKSGTPPGLPDLQQIERALSETRDYWETWARSHQYRGKHQEIVLRSALTLKLLTFEPTGAVVAAPTTSLPEEIGGERNWDYRFCWLRDATSTLTALMALGYYGEAHDFLEFLRRTCPHVEHGFQILYGIDGRRNVDEVELKHLKGYRDSRPARLGNAAARQKQLDVFGELLQCIYLYASHSAFAHRKDQLLDEVWPMVRETADHVTRVWREPDSGLWELRSPERQFVDSTALCWVALDRALKLAEMVGERGDFSHWMRERAAIRAEIMKSGYNQAVGAFVQAFGSQDLDASALRLPMLGFVSADDPHMLSTISQIQNKLMHGGLVYRYRGVDDGVSGEEGTFAMCTLWLVDNYILLGQLSEAEELFKHVLSFQNDVGLFSEEIEPGTGEQLGNFPQGFSHIALINTAARIEMASLGRKPTTHAILEDLVKGESEPVSKPSAEK